MGFFSVRFNHSLKECVSFLLKSRGFPRPSFDTDVFSSSRTICPFGIPFSIFLVLIVVVAFLLVVVIMVQNPKGGGLSSSFGGGGAQSLGGVQNTNNFLDRTTWTLAIALFALILLSNFSIERNSSSDIKLDNSLEDIRTTSKTTDNLLPVSNDSLN